jgi:hypothetical protein
MKALEWCSLAYLKLKGCMKNGGSTGKLYADDPQMEKPSCPNHTLGKIEVMNSQAGPDHVPRNIYIM